MKKKIWAVCCACLVAFSATGCTKVLEMTEEEQEIIAEYAASSLLNYDRGYNSKYQKDAIEQAKADARKIIEEGGLKTEEPDVKESPAATTKATSKPTATPTVEPTVQPTVMPTDTPVPTPTPVPAESQGEATPTPTPKPNNKKSPYELGKLLGMEGIEVHYSGFEALDAYPVIPEDSLGFTMKASQGTKLIVTKFELSNRTGNARSCNIVGQNIKFQMRFNETDFVGVQKTMLKDDFAALNCTLQPDETKQVVIISQVTAGYETTISSVDLITRVGGENSLIKLQ